MTNAMKNAPRSYAAAASAVNFNTDQVKGHCSTINKMTMQGADMLNLLIARTPTGSLREALTEANIHALALHHALNRIADIQS